MMDHPYKNKVGFAIGTGRCGTQFLFRLMELEKNVASFHERNVLNEAFHRYCKWYELPVDEEGFLHTKEQEIKGDLRSHRFSFESSAPLSFAIEALYRRFDAKFVFLVRSPEKVVDSYLRKGYFDKDYVCEDPKLALGYQETEKFHHFLGRTVPKGAEFERWNHLTRRGKITWFWNQVNAAILDQLGRIPESHSMILKLEDFTYEQYLRIVGFFSLDSQVTQEQFNALTESKPNALSHVPTVKDWNRQEIQEFEQEVAPMAKRFEYEYSIEELKKRSRLVAR